MTFTCRIKGEKVQSELPASAHASKSFALSYWYETKIPCCCYWLDLPQFLSLQISS